jgi:hypothetical protein
MRTALTIVSALTALLAGWAGSMYLILRHPSFGIRASVAAAVAIGAGTLAVSGGRAPASLRHAAALWGACVFALGVTAFTGRNDDGWTLIAGVLLTVEGALVLVTWVVHDRTLEGRPTLP